MGWSTRTDDLAIWLAASALRMAYLHWISSVTTILWHHDNVMSVRPGAPDEHLAGVSLEDQSSGQPQQLALPLISFS